MDLREKAKTDSSMECISQSEGEDMKKAIGARKYLECSALTQEGLSQGTLLLSTVVFEEAIRVVLSPQATSENKAAPPDAAKAPKKGKKAGEGDKKTKKGKKDKNRDSKSKGGEAGAQGKDGEDCVVQ